MWIGHVLKFWWEYKTNSISFWFLLEPIRNYGHFWFYLTFFMGQIYCIQGLFVLIFGHFSFFFLIVGNSLLSQSLGFANLMGMWNHLILVSKYFQVVLVLVKALMIQNHLWIIYIQNSNKWTCLTLQQFLQFKIHVFWWSLT